MKYAVAILAAAVVVALGPTRSGATIIYLENWAFEPSGGDVTTLVPLGANVNDGINGVDLIATNPGVGSLNPQHGIYDGNTNRYFRIRNDLRGGQNDFVVQAGSALTPTGGTGGDRWNTDWDNLETNIGNFQRYSTENWPDDGNTTDVGTPSFGFIEGLNWGLMQTTDGGGITGSAQAPLGGDIFAVGIVWEDLDVDGNIDTGDRLWLRYALSATDFSEIDTTAELNLAVGIPEPGTLVLLGLGGLFLFCRRRS